MVGIAALDTPVVLLDAGRLEANVERMAATARAGAVALRPHAKSHKLPQVAAMQRAAGAVGLTVAKLGEAEVFAAHGEDDILVAYPLWGEAKWARLCDLAETIRVSTVVDSAAGAAGLAAAAVARGLTIPVLVEVDSGFGRCGVAGPEAAAELARVVAEAAGLVLAGITSFAGQSYDEGTQAGVDAVARHDAVVLRATAAALADAGQAAPVVSAGGTPTAVQMSSEDGVTEVRPGAYALSDRNQAALGWGTLEDCALTLLATVVSRPAPTRAIIDAGSKALSSDESTRHDGWGTIAGRPELTFARMTEEHGIIDVPPGVSLDIGTRLRVIPNHCCGTINMHDEVVVIREGEVVERWPVAARAKVR